MPLSLIQSLSATANIEFSAVVTHSDIVIEIAGLFPPTWVQAGFLSLGVLLDGIYTIVKTIPLVIGRNHIKNPLNSAIVRYDNPVYFTSAVSPVISLLVGDDEIDFREDTIESSDILFSHFDIKQGLSLNSLPGGLLSPPRSRKSFRILNDTNRDMFLRFNVDNLSVPILIDDIPFDLIKKEETRYYPQFDGNIYAIFKDPVDSGSRVIIESWY